MAFLRWLWDYVKAFGKAVGRWLVRYPLAAVATVTLILVAILALASGKKFQLGGLLGKLWGKEKGPNKRGVPPEDRTGRTCRADVL